MTLAAERSRQAEITRLQELNNESINKLQQQVDLKIRKAQQDRENSIIRLNEAIKTATELGIREPVSWDDLRPERKSTQIVNDLGSKDDFAPLYFRGTRLLQAELELLRSRADDKPFIEGLTDLESQILQLRYDPRIEALNARANDTIYIENYDALQRDLKDLLSQAEHFSNVQMAVISQPATVPSGPTRSPLIIVVIGLIVSGFLALIIACVRLALRNSKHEGQPLTSNN
jgi:LPS O-antigen subunit length determinant protein (WzzB/FepE family)